MRLTLPVTLFAAVFGALASGGPAVAQFGGHMLLNPTGRQAILLPWERSLQRYYDRERMARQRGANPLSGLRTVALDRRRALLRRFYDNPARALRLPANVRPRASATGAPPLAPLVFAPVVSLLDVNGDGAVSRREYFGVRARGFRAGARGSVRARRWNRRLAARFRALDSNRDGRVTPDEVTPYPNARF